MSTATNRETRNASEPGESASQDELNALRELLFGTEKKRLDEVQKRLEDPELSAQHVARVLAEAYRIRSRQDGELGDALGPTISEAFDASIKEEPKKLADAIAPIMGPAIRASIVQAIRGMVQSLNKTLEQSFSWQGLKWRIEARRTGKSFGEIVLLHTLAYQVEQVFLIQPESGLLMRHVARDDAAITDSDMVSGMLTAIQDFVRDSFGGAKDDSLRTMHVGDYTVWVESGSEAALAVVIRGEPPEDLRHVVKKALERVHLENGEALRNFEGDTSTLENAEYEMEQCLQAQYQKDAAPKSSKKALFVLATVALLIVGLVGVLGLRGWQTRQGRLAEQEQHQRDWIECVELFRTEPGYVVTNAESRNGKFYLAGLRDPLAREPEEVFQSTNFNSQDAGQHWQPYHSLEPRFVTSRARKILRPPYSIDLRLDGDELNISGTARHEWITDHLPRAQFLAGISSVNVNVVNLDAHELNALSASIDREILLFERNSSELTAESRQRLILIAGTIKQVLSTAESMRQFTRIEITGHAAAVGDDGLAVSRSQGQSVKQELIALGLPESVLVTSAEKRVQSGWKWRQASGLACKSMGDVESCDSVCDTSAMNQSAATVQKKICMIGAFAVGKTSLVARFVNSMFSEKYQTTIGVKIDKKAVNVDGQKVNLILWDLAGEDEFQEVRMSYLRGASGYLLVLDGTRPETFNTALELHKKAEGAVGELSCLVLLNKADLIEQWQILDSALETLGEHGLKCLKTSAKTGVGVEDAFNLLARDILAKQS